jgi:plastocyanin
MALSATPAAAQTTHIVEAAGISFDPPDITISVGDTVRWIYLELASHNVAETDCPSDVGSVYNGGIYSGPPGAVDEFEVTFNSPGQICYICEPHAFAGMLGTINVLAPVPTLGEWGLISMGALFALAGGVLIARRA